MQMKSGLNDCSGNEKARAHCKSAGSATLLFFTAASLLKGQDASGPRGGNGLCLQENRLNSDRENVVGDSWWKTTQFSPLQMSAPCSPALYTALSCFPFSRPRLPFFFFKSTWHFVPRGLAESPLNTRLLATWGD